MKLYAICLVKDEDDIIAQALTYATRHCDKIFVIDNGSSDRTWDIAQALAVQYPQIVPFEQTYLAYNDALRARVYNQVHQELLDDDWWMILDSDEFMAEDPKELIQKAMRDKADIIRSWQIQFYLTEKDLAEWEAGRDNRNRPIFERRRYYLINWQEPRLFRNQAGPAWDVSINNGVPNGLKRVWHRRILNRHYQFRDPEQIEKRLKLRFGNPSFRAHVTSSNWRTTVRDSHKLNYLQDGEPWRFSPSGVAYYYRRTVLYTLQGKFRGAMRRLRRIFRGGS
ncbi:MAG: glycosyltransferase family 2 protein [Gammaproteobacteria bacterium]|nr:glycosyltransferase family 2 protein [Gammaproteobacteria bacterium]